MYKRPSSRNLHLQKYIEKGDVKSCDFTFVYLRYNEEVTCLYLGYNEGVTCSYLGYDETLFSNDGRGKRSTRLLLKQWKYPVLPPSDNEKG